MITAMAIAMNAMTACAGAGHSYWRSLQKACPKADAFYTIGRRVILPFAGALPLHKAPAYVEGHAVGGGFAAAHRMSIYMKGGLV